MWTLLIIFYFIWIPICFISYWASICAYSHEIHWKDINWKDIKIGEFLTTLWFSIIPLVNLIASLIFCDELYKRGICFTFLDKPLFHEKN